MNNLLSPKLPRVPTEGLIIIMSLLKIDKGIRTVMRVNIKSNHFSGKGDLGLDEPLRAGNSWYKANAVHLICQVPKLMAACLQTQTQQSAPPGRKNVLPEWKNKALRTKTEGGGRTSSSFIGDLQQSLSKWTVLITTESLVCRQPGQ